MNQMARVPVHLAENRATKSFSWFVGTAIGTPVRKQLKSEKNAEKPVKYFSQFRAE